MILMPKWCMLLQTTRRAMENCLTLWEWCKYNWLAYLYKCFKLDSGTHATVAQVVADCRWSLLIILRLSPPVVKNIFLNNTTCSCVPIFKIISWLTKSNMLAGSRLQSSICASSTCCTERKYISTLHFTTLQSWNVTKNIQCNPLPLQHHAYHMFSIKKKNTPAKFGLEHIPE